MKIAMSVEFGHDDQLIFAQQLGIDHVLVCTDQVWNAELLNNIKNRVTQCGLILAGLEGFDYTNQWAQDFLAAAEESNINLISTYSSDSRKSVEEPNGRGKALVRSILKENDKKPNETLLQLSEKSSVDVAWTYPSLDKKHSGGIDLQIEELNGTLKSHLSKISSPIHIARLGNRLGKNQSFLDDGEISIPQTLNSLRSLDFSGYVATTAPPSMIDDTDWKHKGRSYDIGYLKAIIQTLESN